MKQNSADEKNFLALLDQQTRAIQASEMVTACKKYPRGAEVLIRQGYAYLRVANIETRLCRAD